MVGGIFVAVEKAFAIIIAVYKKPGLTGRKIRRYLRSKGIEINSKEVNRFLYRNSRFFKRKVGENSKPAWYLKDEVADVFEKLIKNN